jgi:hypothetical protein
MPISGTLGTICLSGPGTRHLEGFVTIVVCSTHIKKHINTNTYIHNYCKYRGAKMEHNIPLYGVIPHLGGEWTIEYMAEETINKKGVRTSTVTGRYSGYGTFPFDKYPNLPVIDFTSVDVKTTFKAINLPDTIKSKEENPIFYTGTLKSYLMAVKGLGVRIINDPFEGVI